MARRILPYDARQTASWVDTGEASPEIRVSRTQAGERHCGVQKETDTRLHRC